MEVVLNNTSKQDVTFQLKLGKTILHDTKVEKESTTSVTFRSVLAMSVPFSVSINGDNMGDFTMERGKKTLVTFDGTKFICVNI